jgi:signal transduction histidine kinase
LRLRIALALALACLLVVGTLGVALYAASEKLEKSLIEQIVADEMDYLLRRSREDPDFAPRPSGNPQVHIVRGAQDEARLPQHLRTLAPGRHELSLGKEEELHVFMREDGGARYYVAYEVGLHEQREQEFKALVLLFVLVAALVSLLLGYGLSGMLVSQVARLAQQVSALKPGQNRGTLAQPGQDPEVALLARAFDDYQMRIESLIRREQEFTSNASHELRTPLTAIKTSCELLLGDRGIGEKSRARLLQVNDAAARMAEQLEALLLLARGQPLGTEPVVLAECVALAAEPCRADIARKGLAFEVMVPSDAVLQVNHQALRLVLANLIRNAVRYTERGFVKVRYASKRVTVADSGRGISAENLPRIFERFFRDDQAASGTGLGLSIVKRVCEHNGWRIEVESTPGKGSSFSLLLP